MFELVLNSLRQLKMDVLTGKSTCLKMIKTLYNHYDSIYYSFLFWKQSKNLNSDNSFLSTHTYPLTSSCQFYFISLIISLYFFVIYLIFLFRSEFQRRVSSTTSEVSTTAWSRWRFKFNTEFCFLGKLTNVDIRSVIVNSVLWLLCSSYSVSVISVRIQNKICSGLTAIQMPIWHFLST